MPVRIYEIAKKLNLESKFVLNKAKELGIAAAKVPSSTLDKITAEFLEEQLAPLAKPVEPPKPVEMVPVTIIHAPPPPEPPPAEPEPVEPAAAVPIESAHMPAAPEPELQPQPEAISAAGAFPAPVVAESGPRPSLRWRRRPPQSRPRRSRVVRKPPTRHRFPQQGPDRPRRRPPRRRLLPG